MSLCQHGTALEARPRTRPLDHPGQGGVPPTITSALRCMSRTVGAAATRATRKNMTKFCENIVPARPRTRPTRKSLSAKRADIVVFVMKGPFELVLVGVGPRPWSDANA